MGTIGLFWSDKLKIPEQEKLEVSVFLQQIINRYLQGHCRYAAPNTAARYMTRLLMETREYKKTGNKEQLFNIAVYCILESMKPENKKYHYNSTIDSVTRGKI